MRRLIEWDKDDIDALKFMKVDVLALGMLSCMKRGFDLLCVNASRWDCTLELIGQDRFAVRLGMRMVRGLANADAAKILASRAHRTFASVDDLWRRSEAPVASLVELAKADAFGPALGIALREALWAIKALRDEALPPLRGRIGARGGDRAGGQRGADHAEADDRWQGGGRGLRRCRHTDVATLLQPSIPADAYTREHGDLFA